MIVSIGVRLRDIRPVELVCPRCGLDRVGTKMTRTRWVCLLGAAIYPVGHHDQVVACDECGHVSDIGVLDVPTTEQLSTLLEDALFASLVVAIRSVDRSCVDRAIALATDAVELAGFSPDGARLERELATLTRDAVRRRLNRLGCELTPHGKQGFLHRVLMVAMADDSFGSTHREALASIGCDLGMAAPHINGTLFVATAA